MESTPFGVRKDSTIAMNLEDAIRARRSTHFFKSGAPITQGQWEKLFELTALSPSSYNFQPWDFIIVEDQERRKELQPLCWNQTQVADCAAIVVVLGDKDPHRRAARVLRQFRDNGYFPDEDTYNAYLQSVDVVYPDEGRKIEHAVGGASLAAMTFMLAAHGLGLATLAMLGFEPDGVRKFFKVPDDYLVAMLIAVGHSAEQELPRQQRRGFEEIVHWDQFGGQRGRW